MNLSLFCCLCKYSLTLYACRGKETIMKPSKLVLLMPASLLLFLACFSTAKGTPDKGGEGASPAGGGAVPAGLRVETLYIHPVLLLGKPMKNVAEALGLVLEKKGFSGVRVADRAFLPTEGASFEARAAAFGAFVAEKPPSSGHALYAEFEGTPGKGVAAVRAVLVDRAGKVVWKDVQVPGDPAFDRVKPSEPLECCVLLAERLDPLLAEKKPDEGVEKEGPMARLWAKKSGLPDERERKAMEARRGLWKKKARETTTAVYPVRLWNKVDPEAAKHLAGLLDGKVCKAEPLPAGPLLEVPPSSNEMKMLWDLARAFKEQVKKAPPKTEYALYADYMMSPRDGRVMAVHFVVCDRRGEWVVVDMQNEHHRDFKAVGPKGVEDCNRLVLRRLKGYLD